MSDVTEVVLYHGGSLVRNVEGLMKYKGGKNIVLKELEADKLNVRGMVLEDHLYQRQLMGYGFHAVMAWRSHAVGLIYIPFD
ncbi:hypothetical protein A2U01_0048934 [Trifolium medium]|uniref:PB1-like domain-containing protein n=1 Tax=Trifolium medium TaxID=97028 RepID=A0A392QV72_9FABA|nr:hypothetical protein [Trifolium medium]